MPQARVVEARVQRCSACGGQLKDGAAHCSYCGSAVQRGDRGIGETCPDCFARIGSRDRFCGACGLEIQPERIAVVPYDAACPRCRGELKTCTFDTGESYVECARCGGLWLDEERFDSIVQRKDRSPLGKQAWHRAEAQSSQLSASEQEHAVAYLACPKCRQHMHRKNYGYSSGIILDWCKGHGFWFDTEELDRVLRFVAQGGLDRARDRQIEAQRMEVMRWEARGDRARRAPRDPAEHAARFGMGGEQPSFLSAIGSWLLDRFGP